MFVCIGSRCQDYKVAVLQRLYNVFLVVGGGRRIYFSIFIVFSARDGTGAREKAVSTKAESLIAREK